MTDICYSINEPSERNQLWKTTCWMTWLIWNDLWQISRKEVRKKKKKGSQISDSIGLRKFGEMGVTVNGYRVIFWDDNDVLELCTTLALN